VNLAVTFGNFLDLLNNDHCVRRLEARAQLVFQKLLVMLMKLVYLIGDNRAEDPESSIWFKKFERL